MEQFKILAPQTDPISVLNKADFLVIRGLLGNVMTDVEQRSKHYTKKELEAIRLYQYQVVAEFERTLRLYYDVL